MINKVLGLARTVSSRTATARGLYHTTRAAGNRRVGRTLLRQAAGQAASLIGAKIVAAATASGIGLPVLIGVSLLALGGLLIIILIGTFLLVTALTGGSVSVGGDFFSNPEHVASNLAAGYMTIGHQRAWTPDDSDIPDPTQWHRLGPELYDGRIDERLVEILAHIGQHTPYRITASGVFAIAGHHFWIKVYSGTDIDTPCTRRKGCYQSLHKLGRAIDIGFVDGQNVNDSNTNAKQLVVDLACGYTRTPAAHRLEVGHPYSDVVKGSIVDCGNGTTTVVPRGFWNDSAHEGHIHLGVVCGPRYRAEYQGPPVTYNSCA